MADPNLHVRVTADTTDAMAKLTELRDVAEPLSELLEVKPDRTPWVFATLGWIVAVLIAVLQP